MELITSNDILRDYFPNVLLEVDDELAFYDKIKGYLRSAEQWLSANIFGSAYVLEGSALNIARRITVDRALAQAIPSLDLVLTPNGLGIVSTESLAPASKERVERLIGSLESSASAHLEILLDMLREDAKWRSSRQGSYFCGTLVNSFQEISRWRGESDLLSAFARVRDLALLFEAQLRDAYFGNSVVNSLIKSHNEGDDTDEIVYIIDRVKEVENRYIDFHIRDQKFKHADTLELWKLVNPLVSLLRTAPELYQLWRSEMEDAFTVEPFKNNVQGGYFF
jgi:hypothetical protein